MSIPRRARIDLMTKEELGIFNMVGEVEKLGAHPMLTSVVVLLGEARNKLADWVDLQKYDSRDDTQAHIEAVRSNLQDMIEVLFVRQIDHDASKLESPEKEMYDEFTPKLRGLTYGSEEYKVSLAAMGPALKHHYEVNSHHPEHYENGVQGMSLFDILEMVADWKAASMRHADGNFQASLEINRKRFEIDDHVWNIILNTVKELGW
jgi:hypothetical protein